MRFPEANDLDSAIERIELPPLAHMRYDPPVPQVDDIPNATNAALAEISVDLEPGATVALGVGSRGIHAIDRITKTAVAWLFSRGYEPVVVPAMGSHGGGTAAGQRDVLDTLGIDADTVGCPIDARMETTAVGAVTIGDHDVAIPISDAALAADACIPINRIAPHTSFSGRIESGICKMLAVGFGNRPGARLVHRFGQTYGFVPTIEAILPVIREALSVPGGIGIVENAHDRTAQIGGLSGDSLIDDEATMLRDARELFPSLPVDTVDLLIVDAIGKDISGTGMDPNVTGRPDAAAPPGTPDIAHVYVRSLSAGTAGNANGVGLADAIHHDVATEIDLGTTYANVLTSGYPRKAALPLVLPSDEHAIHSLIDSLGVVTPEELRIVWIEHTKDLTSMRVSPALAEGIDDPAFEIVGWDDIRFDNGSARPRAIDRPDR